MRNQSKPGLNPDCPKVIYLHNFLSKQNLQHFSWNTGTNYGNIELTLIWFLLPNCCYAVTSHTQPGGVHHDITTILHQINEVNKLKFVLKNYYQV